jgi:hypothetical protein
MKKSTVSPEFMSFVGRNATAIEQAKQAESRLSGVPVPLGTKGTCIITSFVFSKSKDKPNPDGTIKEGTPFCEIKTSIVDHPEHQGKTLRKTYWFNNSANMTAIGRYEMFLNDMEKIGLPRDVRTAHQSPAEIGEYFLNKEGLALHFDVYADQYGEDGKGLRFSNMDTVIASNDSIMPPMAAPAPAPAAPVAAPAAASVPGVPAVGAKVKYLEQLCEVVEVFEASGKVHIKGIDNPSLEKMVLISNLDS